MLSGGAGSTSDVDGGAGSAGEMSESGKTKKLKLNPPAISSQGGTPQGSRANSPAPLGSKGFTGSRASSPEGGASFKGKYLCLSNIINSAILILKNGILICTSQAKFESRPL